jgi:hypothetical protein
MIVTISLELPDAVETPWFDSIEILDSEVRDPAAGVIGHATGPARIRWSDRRRYLEVTIDIDDDAAIAAATRNGAIF